MCIRDSCDGAAPNPPSTPAPIERRPADGKNATRGDGDRTARGRWRRRLLDTPASSNPARATCATHAFATRAAACGCGRREVVVPRAPPFASRAFQNETLGRSNSSFERSEGASFPSPRQSPIRTKSSLEKMSRARESRTPDRRSSNQRLVPLATASPSHPPSADATRSSREMRAAGSRRRRSRHRSRRRGSSISPARGGGASARRSSTRRRDGEGQE